MENNQERIQAYFREVKQRISDELSLQLGPMKTISLSNVSDQEGLNLALDLALHYRSNGKECKIGVVNPDIPDTVGIGFFRRGQVVVFEEEENNTLSVYTPWSEEVRERLKTNLRDSLTVNVPRNLIRPIGKEENEAK